MNRTEATECLKFLLGTLFLSSYRLPTSSHVKNIIGSGVKLFTTYKPFVSMGCILRHLIQKVKEREQNLFYFSEGSFLGLFSDRLLLLEKSIAPTNLETSCFLFFEKFFDYHYCPRSDEHIEEMVEWCLYSVQFSESNSTRVSDALKLLEEVQNHLYLSKLNAMFDMNLDTLDSPNHRFDGGPTLNDLFPKPEAIDEETQTVENESPEVAIRDGSGMLTKAYFEFSDTKHCDCEDYEASGDCYHVDDIGAIASAV